MIIENGTYSVYMHINKVNGKVYIGTTSKFPAGKRWCGNGIGYKKHNTRFYHAIQEFGWDNFEHVIFASNLTVDEASNMEKFLIKKLNTRNPEKGYNVDAGGLTKTEIRRRARISDSVSGKKHPLYGTMRNQETKDKIRKALSGENGYWYGQKMPEEVGRKISIKMQGNTNGLKHIEECKKSVICIETNQVYESIMSVERILGIHHSAVSMVLHNKRQTAGGFHWKYA